MTLAVAINLPPQSQEYLGPRLRLVQDDNFVVANRSLPFQIHPQAIGLLFHVVVAPAELASEGGLATLTRTDQRDRRVVGKTRPQDRHDFSLEHSCKIEIHFYFARRASSLAADEG